MKFLNTIKFCRFIKPEIVIIILALLLSIASTTYFYIHADILAYADAESHLNIAKRVVSSITPGFAQLGGVWLPLPHLLMVPLVANNFLWRTGLAGSIVSGAAYIISSLFLYRLTFLLTKSRSAAFIGASVFMLNANILYLQTTPLTELTLIVFFTISSYYFIKFLLDRTYLINLLLAALFGFFASLSRYDGWGLVLMEAGIIFILYFPYTVVWNKYIPNIVKRNSAATLKHAWSELEGKIIIFSTLAFFGIFLWILWCYVILGDPLYFIHSQFSANSQQTGWLTQGELPAYHHILVSNIYYVFTTISNLGIYISILAAIGLLLFMFCNSIKEKWYILLVLSVPFVFNVATLYLGQSVIFIPGLTPSTYSTTLFNVRYGVMMVPFAAVVIGYLFSKSHRIGKIFLILLILIQASLFISGSAQIITLQDGLAGHSSFNNGNPVVQSWIDSNYKGGFVLIDDYARAISIIRSNIPMQKIIYVGNKPYWQNSIRNAKSNVTWIIMQKGDTVWNTLWATPQEQSTLLKNYTEVFSAEDIVILKVKD
jgi:hypothetical protein